MLLHGPFSSEQQIIPGALVSQLLLQHCDELVHTVPNPWHLGPPGALLIHREATWKVEAAGQPVVHA